MGASLTNGYDIVFQVSEPAFRRQVAALPSLQQTVRTSFVAMPFEGRARIRLSQPSAEFKSPVSVSERITISVDIAGSALTLTKPKPGVIPLEGSLVLAGRVRVQPVATAPGSREVVLDFTTRNGGPDVLELNFPPGAPETSAGLLSVGIPPSTAILDLLRNLIKAEVKTWIGANLRTVVLAGPIALSGAPGGAFAPTQVDAHVIEDPSGPDRDALAIAIATCRGANPGLDPTLFTSSAVPVGQDAAVIVSNFTLLSCIMRPRLAAALGLSPASFSPPCVLTAPVGLTLSGLPPVTLTSLIAIVTPGGVIAVRGAIRLATTVATLDATLGVDIRLTLPATPPAGTTGPAIVPVTTVLPSTASITIAWWVWLTAAALILVLLPGIIAVAVLVGAAIANGILNSGLAAAITTGVSGSLPAVGAIPLGPLAAGFTPTALTLDDLTLTGSVTIASATDTMPRLMVVDSARQRIDAIQLAPQPAQSDTSFKIYVLNRGSVPITLQSITKVDDPANAFLIPDGSVLPRIVPPGQMDMLPCRFKPSQAGRYLPVITLNSDDTFGPVKADIEAEAVALPPHGILEATPDPLDFGKLVAKTQATRILTLRNVGTASLDLTNVVLSTEVPAGWFLLPWSWPGTIPAGQSRTLPITFVPTVPGIMPSATLAIDTQSAGGLYWKHHDVALKGRVGAPGIRLAPTPLDFGALPPGASATLSFEIHNDGDMDLEVQGIGLVAGGPNFLLDPSVTFPLTVPPGGQQVVGVTTTAATWPGYVNTSEFEVRSNDPATPGARLKCVCATAGPRIEVLPDFVEFGRPQALPARATVTIHNRGSSPLDIRAVRIGGAPFSLVGVPSGPFAVAAGQSATFDIEFDPGTAGNYADVVAILSTDGLRPNVGLGVHAVS